MNEVLKCLLPKVDKVEVESLHYASLCRGSSAQIINNIVKWGTRKVVFYVRDASRKEYVIPSFELALGWEA